MDWIIRIFYPFEMILKITIYRGSQIILQSFRTSGGFRANQNRKFITLKCWLEKPPLVRNECIFDYRLPKFIRNTFFIGLIFQFRAGIFMDKAYVTDSKMRFLTYLKSDIEIKGITSICETNTNKCTSTLIFNFENKISRRVRNRFNTFCWKFSYWCFSE